MLAAWIAPGAIVPASANQDAPLILGTRKIRGYDSSGMLAGADELDFGTDHGGIVEIDPKTAKPGDKLADLFDLDDTILDVENKPLTRRPDCFGIIGFAREVAGILGQPFKTPDFLIDGGSDFILKTTEKLDIKIADHALCPRYTALIMSRKDEPKKYLKELDTLISRSGMRPIDPIVDLTNYLMLLTGQPLHAFDYDKLMKVGKTPTPKIIVRAAKPGEKLELLDGRTIKCTENDILITSNNVPVALAGAMGCQNTVIDEHTKKIIIESATFSLYNLRKTQMQHGIFSEAITRFTKGQPVGNTLPVTKQFAALSAHHLKPLAIFDEYPHPTKPSVVKITTHDMNHLLGTDYSVDSIKQTLENVGFVTTVLNDSRRAKKENLLSSFSEDSLPARTATSIPDGTEGFARRAVPSDTQRMTSPAESESDEKAAQRFSITAPYWRTDIHIKEDVIEEVGRLLGYDNIEPTIPPIFSATKNPLFTLKTQIRGILSAAGANEVLTYSFIHGDVIKNANQDPKNSYKIVNSLSPDLQYFRQSLTPSLLDKAYLNIDDGYLRFALFEMNQVYQKAHGLDSERVPTTRHKLTLTISAPGSEDPYFIAKKYLEKLFSSLNVDYDLVPFTGVNASDLPFELKRSAQIKTKDHKSCLGIVGEYKASVHYNFNLPVHLAGFELNLETILEYANQKPNPPQISRFPFAKRDLTLTVPETTPYQTIHDKIHKILTQQNLIFTISPVAIYQPKGKTTKNLTFHLEFAHPNKTLTSDEINVTIRQLEKIK